MIPFIKCHLKFDSALVGALLAEKIIVTFNFISFKAKREKLNSVFSKHKESPVSIQGKQIKQCG